MEQRSSRGPYLVTAPIVDTGRITQDGPAVTEEVLRRQALVQRLRQLLLVFSVYRMLTALAVDTATTGSSVPSRTSYNVNSNVPLPST